MDLALNNQQRLICHKTKSNQAKPNWAITLQKHPKTFIVQKVIVQLIIEQKAED